MGTYGRVRPGLIVPSRERAFTRECLRAAGAEEFARQRFAELSGGQKQRVLIARALTTRPDILVLDEPTAGVDRNATHAVMEFISQIRKERKITVLLVTHDFTAVRQHAEQVIWLHEGMVFCGTAQELLSAERMAKMFERGID
jgi:ABC-type Mn2+/Zn2+ transport system ATPase subunit